MTADRPPIAESAAPPNDPDLWAFLRLIEQEYAPQWHAESPRAQWLRRLQGKYDPAHIDEVQA